MATHSNIVAWRIPWTEETGGLQRVKHGWVTNTFTFAGFGLSCFHCHFFSVYFLPPLYFLKWSLLLCSNLFSSHVFVVFTVLFPVTDLKSPSIVFRKIFDTISIFLNFLRLDLLPKVWLSWRTFHVHMRNIFCHFHVEWPVNIN